MKYIKNNYNTNNLRILVIFSFFLILFLTNCGSNENRENSNIVSKNNDSGDVGEIEAIETKTKEAKEDIKKTVIKGKQQVAAETDKGKQKVAAETNKGKQKVAAETDKGKQKVAAEADKGKQKVAAKTEEGKQKVHEKTKEETDKIATKIDKNKTKPKKKVKNKKNKKTEGEDYILTIGSLKVKIKPDIYFDDLTKNEKNIEEYLGNILVASNTKKSNNSRELSLYLTISFEKFNDESNEISKDNASPISLDWIKILDMNEKSFETNEDGKITLNSDIYVNENALNLKPKANKKNKFSDQEKVNITNHAVIIKKGKNKNFDLITDSSKKYKSPTAIKFSILLKPNKLKNILDKLKNEKNVEDLKTKLKDSGFSKFRFMRKKSGSQKNVIKHLKENQNLVKRILEELFKDGKLVAKINGKELSAKVKDIDMAGRTLELENFHY